MQDLVEPELPCPAYPAAAVSVVAGVQAGLVLGADPVAGDVLRLARDARPEMLVITPGNPGHVAAGSATGRVGEPVTPRLRLSLMAGPQDRSEAMLVSIGTGRDDADLWLVPLTPLAPGADMVLLAATAVDDDGAAGLVERLAAAFLRGTRIALSDGRHVPVETLAPGDAILTRDRGAQTLRWLGRARLRAEGAFAPVVIAPGVLGNPEPLSVSPHHRLFLYRRAARAVAGAAELMVEARHLVDGEAIRRVPGVWAEYFALAFDAHEVIYAEGVPCESLIITPAIRRALPTALAEDLARVFPGLQQQPHIGMVMNPETLALLRGLVRGES
jgi:hypothetical protein